MKSIYRRVTQRKDIENISIVYDNFIRPLGFFACRMKIDTNLTKSGCEWNKSIPAHHTTMECAAKIKSVIIKFAFIYTLRDSL